MSEDINININLSLVKLQINKIVSELIDNLQNRTDIIISIDSSDDIKKSFKKIIISNLNEIIEDLKNEETDK